MCFHSLLKCLLRFHLTYFPFLISGEDLLWKANEVMEVIAQKKKNFTYKYSKSLNFQ